MNSKTKQLTTYSLFTALTAVLSQIAISLPFTPVPLNLATLSVLLAGALLGKKGGMLSQLVYVLLGAVGIPVFANFSGGIGVITGPTGGYIIGYIVAAFTVGIVIEKSSNKLIYYVLSMILGTAVCYTIGTAWFMYTTGNSLTASLTMCVVPFIPGDILKIVLASTLTSRLIKVINKKQTN